jgi:hypothetical protein
LSIGHLRTGRGKVSESISKINGKGISAALYGGDDSLRQFAYHIRSHRAVILAALVRVERERYRSLIGPCAYSADQFAGQTFYFDTSYVRGKIEIDPEETGNDLFQDLLSASPLPLHRPGGRYCRKIRAWNDCQVVHRYSIAPPVPAGGKVLPSKV